MNREKLPAISLEIKREYINLTKNRLRPRSEENIKETKIKFYKLISEYKTIAVDLFNDTVETEFAAATPEQKAAARETVIKFIITRLTGTVRLAITGAVTLEEIL